ncbi:hypothetical protein EMCRGX_G020295 [Ephydatia muelleri]
MYCLGFKILLEQPGYCCSEVYWSLQSFEFYNINGASETKRFADMFDRFFDCLNVKNLGEYKKKKKPNLSPYYDPNEECLTWLEKEFLGYLKEWKESVDNRSGFTEAEKALMCLSKETLEGLHMTEAVQSLRVQGSLAMLPIRGNSSLKRRLFHDSEVVEDIPLPKRLRQKH